LLSSERFDPTLNTWSPLPDMNERRVEGGWENMGVSPERWSVGALEPWISILVGWSSWVWSSFTFFVQGLVNVLSCGILNITLKYLLEISSIPSNYGWCSIRRFTIPTKQQWLTFLKRWVARRSGAASVALMIWGSPAWLGAPAFR
jgi:hypothetical protein